MRFLTVTTLLLISGAALAQVQDPPQWNGTDTYTGGGLVRGADGNFYRALRTNTARSPLSDDHTYWEFYYVRASVNLTVATSGGRFTSFKKAFDMVSSATIANDARATIAFNTSKAAYLENYSGPISLNATCGSQIFIQGDNVANVTLNFANGVSGFYVNNSHHLGSLSNVTVLTNTGYVNQGLRVFGDSSIQSIDGLDISGFYDGIQAYSHSHLSGNFVKVYNFNGEAAHCWLHSNLELPNCVAQGLDPSHGTAFNCGDSSNMDVELGYCTHCASGYHTSYGGMMNADKSTATNLSASGYRAEQCGVISAINSTSSGNAGNGFVANDAGRIMANGATVSSNGADFNPAPNAMDAKGNLILH